MAGFGLFGRSVLDAWLATASAEDAELVIAWLDRLLADPTSVDHQAVPGERTRASFHWVEGTGVVLTYRWSLAPIRGVYLLTIEDVDDLLREP